MNKLNKLFAILFAVLGVGNLSAQTDVTDTYLTNAGFDDSGSWITGDIGQTTTNAASSWKASSSGDTWWYGGAVGYGSSLKVNSVTPPATNPDGTTEGGALGISAGWGCTVTYTQEVTLPAGVYTLSYAAYNANTSATQAKNLIGFVSSSASCYGKTTSFAANTWTKEDVIFALTTETTGNISVGMGAISGGSGANAKLFVDGVTLTYKPFSDVTPENPVDLTSMVSNAQSAWTGATECPNYDGISMPAVYKSSDWTGDALSQTINGLPVGKYEMEAYCQAHSSWDADAAAEGAIGYTYLCANEYKLDVPIRNADGATTKLLHTFEDMSITGGTLKISVVNEQLAANWLQIYVKSLTFLGPDKTLYEEAFNTRYTSLSALDTEAVPSAFATKITDLKTQYNVEATTLTLSQLEEANAAMDVLLNSYEGVAAAYANIKSLITLCETYAAEDYSIVETDGVRTTFTSAIATAKTDADAATSASELNTVYNTLESARRVYVVAAIPTDGNSFDMTFKIINAEVASADGWTNASGRINSSTSYTGAPDRFALDVGWWTSSIDINQEVTGLPNGTYTLSAITRSDADSQSYIYIKSGDEQVTANLAKYGTSNGALGNGWEEVTTSGLNLISGTMTVGAYMHNPGATFAAVDNFKLYRAYDVTTAQNDVTELKAKAQTLVGKVMNSDIAAALNNAIGNVDDTNSNPFELAGMIDALSTAIANAEASVADYALIRKYIDKAKVFDADAAELAAMETKYTNGEFTAVEPVRQALNVWTANYVATNFKNEIALTEWSAASNAMWSTSGEHWDGTTGEGCTSYYDANGTNTTHTLSKTVGLTPGTYVFRGAGRSNTNTELSLSIDIEGIEPVVFNAKGNTGYGIATDGTATFDPEAQYARNDEGQGWEWEFIKFTLTENTTVTLTATCKTTGWGWASFANNGLWMDDATYVEANAGALDTPMAEAKALVNTKPMGTNENTALQEAIELGEGAISTPAELNAAVDALKGAVANANAWLAAYNEAKVPLVAALERFETDYNDAENGALDYMNKSRWATAIEKAQAAAEAKDATDSYAGFADATAALVDALDAATVSVNEYASLKSAITEATVVRESEVNWGDAPFQRPESAREGLNTAISAAESGYNAAAADGEEVTALIDAMVVTLNAPQDAYCITVATDGHAYVDCPVVASSGSITDNNPTGYGLAAKAENEDLLAQLYTFTQVEGNRYCISVTVEGETVYLTYGVLNDSQAGHKNWQIQGNTDIAKAGEFEVVASTTTEGVFRLRNTVTGTYLDCQDGGAIYTDDNIAKDEFALTSATGSADINISADAKLGTCVLMFDAQLPDGLTAYVPESYDNEVLTLKMVTGGVLPAYTPCLLYAEGGYEGTLTGTVTMNGYAGKVTGDDGLLYGAIESQTITEGYILQKHDGEEVAKFYSVDGLEEEIPISAGKCWLTLANGVEEALETPAAVAFFFRGGGATKLNAVVMDKTSLDGAIYTLDGKRVNTMQRGEIYIINGQKVMVK